jgi:hypothetical protein
VLANPAHKSLFFFLWDHLKSIIFNKKPRMSIDLKENIRTVCAKALMKVLTIVSTSLNNRLNVCKKLYGMQILPSISVALSLEDEPLYCV